MLPTLLPGSKVAMIRIPIRHNVLAPLHDIVRSRTYTGASPLQVRVGRFDLLRRDAGADDRREYFDSRMNICFMRVRLVATVAAAVATIVCSSAHAQSNLTSMRAQYSSGDPQRGGQTGSESSLSPLLGSPPDHEMNDLSGDDTSGSTRSQTSARDGQTRNTKPSQDARISSLYGAPKDYEDSYSTHFGSQSGKTDGARHLTSYGLAAVEGLALPEAGSGGRASARKATSRRNTASVRIGQSSNSDMVGSSMATSESSFVTRPDSSGGRDTAPSFYRSPW